LDVPWGQSGSTTAASAGRVTTRTKRLSLPAPGIDQEEAICRADAIAILNEVFGHMFPGLHEA
jgi:hypothetical protein